MIVVDLLIAVLCLVVGALLGALFAQQRSARNWGASEAQRAQLAAQCTALAAERADLAGRLEGLQSQLVQVNAERVQLEAHLQHAVTDGNGRLELVRQEQQRSQEIVERIAGQAVQRGGNELLQRFLQIADERSRANTEQAKGELDQRRVAVEALVKPLGEQLDKVIAQVQAIEKDRAGAYAELREQVSSMGRTSEQLRSETHQLVSALKKPQVRGRWGERQLRNVVEAAGMLERVDFTEQVSVTNDDGRLRPDMVVNIGGGKTMVVDAKAPIAAFLEAQEARDEAARAEAVAAHARHVKSHVDALAAKEYWAQFTSSPEYVVMFLPAESFLVAAEEQNPALWDYACRKRVILATPANLVTILRSVAYIWRQEAITENAQQVLAVGRELHDRLGVLGGHFSKLGRDLDNAVTDYNKTLASLETRVLVSARKLTELQVSDKTLAEPKPASGTIRRLQAPELVGVDEDVERESA